MRSPQPLTAEEVQAIRARIDAILRGAWATPAIRITEVQSLLATLDAQAKALAAAQAQVEAKDKLLHRWLDLDPGHSSDCSDYGYSTWCECGYSKAWDGLSTDTYKALNPATGRTEGRE